MKDLNSIISSNITTLRKGAGLTQAELAEKLGYSDKAVSKWERGEGIPDVATLVLMAELFETTLDFIVSDQTKGARISPGSMKKKSHIIISALSTLCVWFLSLVVFVCLEMTLDASRTWLSFVIALPTSLIVMLVFNSIWGKQSNNFPIISGIVWSLLLLVYLLLNNSNSWMVFLIGIPLQVGVLLWHLLILPIRKKSK